MFSKASVFNYLALALIIVVCHCWLAAMPNRQDQADALAPVRFTPVDFHPAEFAPLRLAGAWRVDVEDPRFGGVSAMAVDQGKLLALTDSGTVIRLPKPGVAGRAFVHDLGDGPGSPGFKRNRDSEALSRDPAGRGWWIAFEQWNQLWLYDPAFRHSLIRIDLGRKRWRRNKGIEAMIADGRKLTLVPELGNEWLDVRGSNVRVHPLHNGFGYISEAVRMPDGRRLLVTRKFGLAGLTKGIVVADEEKGGGLSLRSLARLGLGARDNVEAIAVEPRARGTRLWLMTDNDFRPRAPTYLVALDLP